MSPGPQRARKAASAFSHLSLSSSLIVVRLRKWLSSSHAFVCKLFVRSAYVLGGDPDIIFYLKRARTYWKKGFGKMVKTLTKNPETVKVLTEKLKKLTVKFDRASYKAAYDKVYFKRTAPCPHCGAIKVRHMLKRHMKTLKCRKFSS